MRRDQSFNLRRRQLMGLVITAASTGVAATGPAHASASPAKTVDTLLLSCMDYRLMDEITEYMTRRGLRDQYDHVVLAGASLGAITERYPAWNRTFWEHLEIAIALHGIRRVILLDHRDCGAYRLILGPEHARNPAVERHTHAVQLHRLKKMIREKYPALEVEALLMALDGTVDALA